MKRLQPSKVRSILANEDIKAGQVVCEVPPHFGVALALGDDVKWKAAGLVLHDVKAGDLAVIVYEGFVELPGILAGRVYGVSHQVPGGLIETRLIEPEHFLGLVGIGTNDNVLYVSLIQPKPIKVSGAPVIKPAKVEKAKVE